MENFQSNECAVVNTFIPRVLEDIAKLKDAGIKDQIIKDALYETFVDLGESKVDNVVYGETENVDAIISYFLRKVTSKRIKEAKGG